MVAPSPARTENQYPRSRELYEQACNVLAGGVSSEFRKAGYPHPLFYAEGHGSQIVDVDGNAYLDFSLSQGPLILGHGHPEVLSAVSEQSQHGQIFAGQFREELDLAKTIQRLVPCAELIRFGLEGSTTVHTALRLARAATGRARYLRFEGHYHGWLDNVAFGINGPNEAALGPREHPTPVPWTQGLPQGAMDEAVVLPWNDLSLVERTLAERGHEIAAVITEPVMCNSSCIPPGPGFLEGLRRLCDQHGIVLIFDEVITGFRVGLGGAQKYFGVTPDVAIFAKAVANGYPLSILAGRRHLMQLIAEGKVIHAGTMNGGVASVAAATATIRVLERDDVHARLFAHGQRLMEGLRAAAKDAGLPLLVQGLGPMFHTGFTSRDAVHDYREALSYDTALGAAFIRGLHHCGIRVLGRGLWYISAAHTRDEIDHAVETAHEVLRGLAA